MTHPDAYKTIKGSTEGEFRDRGSKFIAYLRPCQSDEDIKRHSDDLRKMHPGSRHVCIGAIIGHESSYERSNDDGEPAGTAGLPILNQLRRAELTFAGIFVVRYFGGTKLGKPGLIQAYKESAREAIEAGKVVTRYRLSTLKFVFPYDDTGAIMQAIEWIPHAKITDQEFAQHQTVYASVPVSEVNNALHLFDHNDAISVEAMDD